MPAMASCADVRHQPAVVSASSARVAEPPYTGLRSVASVVFVLPLPAPPLGLLLPPHAPAIKPSVMAAASALMDMRPTCARYRITWPPRGPAARPERLSAVALDGVGVADVAGL